MAICSNGILVHCLCFKWLLGHSGGLQVDLRKEQQICSLAAGGAPVQVTWAADQSGMYWRSQMFGAGPILAGRRQLGKPMLRHQV